jgi:hypothetical protein
MHKGGSVKRTSVVFVLALLVAAPVSAQPIESYLADFRATSPGSASPGATYFDRALSDAELASLFRVGNLDAKTRPAVWKTFPGELLVALHIRLRHAGATGESHLNEVDRGSEELKLDERHRASSLRFLSDSLTLALLNQSLPMEEGKAARDYINRKGDRFSAADNLVIDVLYGQPSFRRWVENENGTKGRSDSAKLDDVVARGAWIGLHPSTLQGPWSHFSDLVTRLNLPPGSTIADMGTAYGRFGFVVGQQFPKLNFVGYEYLEHRVAPSQAAASELGFSNVRFVQADFSAPTFKPVQADVFFTYWSSGQQGVMEGLFDRLLDVAVQKPWIRIVTREFNPQRAMRGESWLVAEGESFRPGDRGEPYTVFKVDPAGLERAVARLQERKAEAMRVREASEKEGPKELLKLPAPKELLKLPAPKELLKLPAPTVNVDRLAEFRRADGTLRWKPLLASRALGEAGGLAQFGLALFLKEIAVVAVSGDRARIDEFFEGLLGTDFYTHYGLFVAGARLTEIGYTKYLQRYVKPRFVSGLLKTNLVLAAGLALPMLYEGTLSGRTLAISLASLGLSSAAVKSGVASLKWVTSIEAAKQRGLLARLSGTQLAKVGGWFYTALELAVVLYVAEPLDRIANDYLDAKAAREALAEAGGDLVRALEADVDVANATAAHHAAWIDYRNFLYHPLQYDEVIFAGRLEELGRTAKRLSDERRAALERVQRHPALAKSLRRRHGSVEAYAAGRASREERELQTKADLYLESYNTSREKHLVDVYEDNLRGTSLLKGVTPLELPHHDKETFASRIAKNVSRSRTAHELKEAYRHVSLNRREAYEDEAEALAFFAVALRQAGREADAQLVDSKRSVVIGLKRADDELRAGRLALPSRDVRDAGGLVEAVKSR